MSETGNDDDPSIEELEERIEKLETVVSDLHDDILTLGSRTDHLTADREGDE